MTIARKAKNNRKRPSSRSQSRSPVSIRISSTLPIDRSSSSSIIIKRQISKEHPRHSPPSTTTSSKHRSNNDVRSHHSSTRHQRRSPANNHDRHRSDVTLYLLNLRSPHLVIIFSTELFQKGVG